MNVRAIGIAGVLALIPAVAAPPASATTTTAARATHRSATITPADRVATHAYLIAVNSLEESELANERQSDAAVEATAARISGECPGVLNGAPPHELNRGPTVSVPSRLPQISPRAEGERNRESSQLETLKRELSLATDSSAQAVNREATAALLSAITPLRWSNPLVTFSLHLTITTLQEELVLPETAVCADMDSWVASGYKTLSPASKEVTKRTEALLKDTLVALALYEYDHIEPFPIVLAPYENAADGALARHSAVLTAQLANEHKAGQEVLKRLEAVVGLPAEEALPIVKHPARKPVVIDRGKTAAGGRFVVRAQPTKSLPRLLRERFCTVHVTIEEASRPADELLSVFTAGGTDRCLSPSRTRPEPSVRCDSGLLTVEANLLPAARRARLLLSDNHMLVSPAIRVPRRLGGPAGLYYQVVRGPSPIPVSLTEFDAHGNTLTVLKLPAVVECARKLKKYVPHGIVRLVRDSVPQGPTFTIRAERYRELGRAHFELTFGEEGGEEPLISISGDHRIESKLEEGDEQTAFIGIGGGGGQVVEPGTKKFQSHASSGCKPQPYAIVYGLLKAPRDTVLVRVSGTLIPLREVAIPAHLHAGGVLAYGAFSPLPTELQIRDSHGKTTFTEDLRQAAQADTETCEGEAEG